jgi:hypothetical protein
MSRTSKIFLYWNLISNISSILFGTNQEDNSLLLSRNLLIYNEEYIDDDVLKISSNNFTLTLIENKFSFLNGISSKNFIYCTGKNLNSYLDNNYFNKIFFLDTFLLVNSAGFNIEITRYTPYGSNQRFNNLFSSIYYKNDFSLKSKLKITSSHLVLEKETNGFISTVSTTNLLIKNCLIEINPEFQSYFIKVFHDLSKGCQISEYSKLFE